MRSSPSATYSKHPLQQGVQQFPVLVVFWGHPPPVSRSRMLIILSHELIGRNPYPSFTNSLSGVRVGPSSVSTGVSTPPDPPPAPSQEKQGLGQASWLHPFRKASRNIRRAPPGPHRGIAGRYRGIGLGGCGGVRALHPIPSSHHSPQQLPTTPNIGAQTRPASHR